MWGKFLFLILIVSLFPASTVASTADSAIVTTQQTTVLQFDTPVQGTIDTHYGLGYAFDVPHYMNVTIFIQTTANVSIYMIFAPDYTGHRTYYTNFANFSKSVYLLPGQLYTFSATGDLGSNLTVTLTEGDQVLDYHNHSIDTAMNFSENEIVTGVLNYTTTWIDNWYNFTITQEGTYRINLWYNHFYPILFFDVSGSNFTRESTFFPEQNITEATVLHLAPGVYNIRVTLPYQTVAYPWVFKLWYTSNYEIQAPATVKVGNTLYGVTSGHTGDMYTLSVTQDAVIWFYGSDPGSVITVSNANNATTKNVNTDFDPTIANMFYTPVGNYSLMVNSTSTDYELYSMAILIIQPDNLDTSGNSAANPFVLQENLAFTGFSLHLPTDHDYFEIDIGTSGTVYVTLTGDLKMTVSNGTQVTTTSTVAQTYFQVSAGQYILDIYTTAIAVPQYSIYWQFVSSNSQTTQVQTSGTSTTSSKLKLGYPFLQTLVLIALPLLIETKFRKFRKLS